MARDSTAVVHLEDGLSGTAPRAAMQRGEGVVVVTLDDGRVLEAPTSAFAQRDDSSFDLPIKLEAVADETTQRKVIPVVAETLAVAKRTVQSGKVQLHKTVQEHEQTVDLPLMCEELEIQRVTVDCATNPSPSTEIRHEGDTLIIPVLEEVLVVTKTVRVREEVRVTRKKVERHAPQTVALRRETVTVERDAVGASSETAAEPRASRSAR